MAKFRKKQEAGHVNAIRNDGRWPTVRDWLIELNPPFGFDFLGTPPITGNGRADGALNVVTSEDTKVAHVGDWIIKDANGKFDICEPDIFEATYEPAEVETPA